MFGMKYKHLLLDMTDKV